MTLRMVMLGRIGGGFAQGRFSTEFIYRVAIGDISLSGEESPGKTQFDIRRDIPDLKIARDKRDAPFHFLKVSQDSQLPASCRTLGCLPEGFSTVRSGHE